MASRSKSRSSSSSSSRRLHAATSSGAGTAADRSSSRSKLRMLMRDKFSMPKARTRQANRSATPLLAGTGAQTQHPWYSFLYRWHPKLVPYRHVVVATSVIVLVAALLILLAVTLPLGKMFARVLLLVKALGPWAPLVLVAIYTIGALLVMPYMFMVLSCGFILQHSLLVAFPTALVSATLGSMACYIVGQRFLRTWVQSKLQGNAKWQAVDRAIGGEGGRLVLFIRLSPVFPFNYTNYALSMSAVSLWGVTWATFLGSAPETFVLTWIGTTLSNLHEILHHDKHRTRKQEIGQTAVLVLGIISTVVAAWLVGRLARRAINKAVERHAVPPSPVDPLLDPRTYNTDSLSSRHTFRRAHSLRRVFDPHARRKVSRPDMPPPTSAPRPRSMSPQAVSDDFPASDDLAV